MTAQQTIDTGTDDQVIALEMQLDDARIAAIAMAQALRDIFNDVGAIKEVRQQFDKVEHVVSQWEGETP